MVDMKKYVDAIGRFSQSGGYAGVSLVRIKSHQTGNRYKAAILAMDSSWSLAEVSGEPEIDVVNICQGSQDDNVEFGTDAVAIDVEGRWIVFIRQVKAGASLLPARVVSSSSSAEYQLELLGVGQSGEFSGIGTTVTATNLAEINLGPGGAVDVGAVVLLAEAASSDDDGKQYFFDHPAYAKYLD